MDELEKENAALKTQIQEYEQGFVNGKGVIENNISELNKINKENNAFVLDILKAEAKGGECFFK